MGRTGRAGRRRQDLTWLLCVQLQNTQRQYVRPLFKTVATTVTPRPPRSSLPPFRPQRSSLLPFRPPRFRPPHSRRPVSVLCARPRICAAPPAPHPQPPPRARAIRPCVLLARGVGVAGLWKWPMSRVRLLLPCLSLYLWVCVAHGYGQWQWQWAAKPREQKSGRVVETRHLQ